MSALAAVGAKVLHDLLTNDIARIVYLSLSMNRLSTHCKGWPPGFALEAT